MSQPLDDEYLTWLYSQIGSVKSRLKTRNYWNLMRFLYSQEFGWSIRNDENRAADGIALRHTFLEETGLENDPQWMEYGCSFLEMMLGLSRRLAFELDGEPRDWFWKLAENLDIHTMTDAHPLEIARLEKTVNNVSNRTFQADGSGGLFPLHHPERDQRTVEIWDQMCAYLLEQPIL